MARRTPSGEKRKAKEDIIDQFLSWYSLYRCVLNYIKEMDARE